MTTFLRRRRLARAACVAFSATVGLVICPASGAVTKPVSLRVVGPAGQSLAQHIQYTTTSRIKTSPRADCFGAGTGGSGERIRTAGATAMGALQDAKKIVESLRPLRVTDTYLDDGYGLGLCGIGGYKATGSAYWYLKQNHAGASVGGSQLMVDRGDEILWYLTPTYPAGVELALKAPVVAAPSTPFEVTVTEYADDGSVAPAVGATVTGGLAPTDSSGKTLVSATAGSAALTATRSGAIPSNLARVCVMADSSQCPDGPPQLIVGTTKDDKMIGTRGDDRIIARGGDDTIIVRRSGHDRITCGSGDDRVIALRSNVAEKAPDPSCELFLIRPSS